MKRDTIIRLSNPAPMDYVAAGMTMQLAWVLTAEELWSLREFDTDHRELFAAKLSEAHRMVSKAKAYRRQEEAAKSDPRIQALKEEQGLLYFEPFGIHIVPRLEQIAAEIAAITATY